MDRGEKHDDASAHMPARVLARVALAAFYLVAGVAHILVPEPFLRIIPTWVPFPHSMVVLGTGLCELAGALALLTSRFRRAAGIALAAYAVCVFPANIKHAVDSVSQADASLITFVLHAFRLSIQPALVWWALLAGGILDQIKGYRE